MGQKLSIDFGTTNSLVARWDETKGGAEVVAIPGLSMPARDSRQPLIPSLLYIVDGRTGQAILGQDVIERGLTQRRDNRLFRNFKRSLLSQNPSEPRLIDGVPWSDHDAGRRFLHGLLSAIPFTQDEIEQLVVTVPVAAFEGYLAWLNEGVRSLAPEAVRVVDESTAAALGYSVTEPGALVLVFDFGGGSLDLSVVQLPESREKTGGLLGNLLGKSASQHTARVISKGGLTMGGSDIDQWLVGETLRRAGIGLQDLGNDYPALLTACEQAKISLSERDETLLQFSVDGKSQAILIRRSELDNLLAEHGFFTAIQRAVDKVMHVAQRQGIFREDIHHVLMVGGASLMPSVQQTLKDYFFETNSQPGTSLCVEHPFTAVVEGALLVATGFGLDDYLAHSYGLRYLDPHSGRHQYDEIVASGSRYPGQPVEVLLQAAHPGQQTVEFVIGEVDTDDVAQVELRYEDGQAVFIAQAAPKGQHILPLNADNPALVPLKPPGEPGQERLRACFMVDEQRQLRLSVTDLKTKKDLARDIVVAKLGEGAAPSDHPHSAKNIFGSRRTLFDPSHPEAFDARTEIAALDASHSQPEANSSSEATSSAKITGHEPELAGGRHESGLQRLSLRNLGALLNVLPPESISLEVAKEALHSDDFYVRFSAAQLLSRRGDRDARLVMQELLTNGTAPQRASIAYHLERFSWFVAEPLLRQALGDPDLRVRESAIYALCRLRGFQAYQLLLETLRQANDRLRLAAAWGLSLSPDAGAVPIMEIVLQAQDPEARIKALEVMGASQAPEALPGVLGALDDADLEVKYAAVLSWIELAGDSCFNDLARLIENSRGEARRSLVRGLFHATNYLFIDIAHSQAAEAIISALGEALRDELPESRLSATMPLAWMRCPQASAVLEQGYYQEKDSDVKARMLYLAVSLMSGAGEKLMKDALESTDEPVRLAAEYLAQRVSGK